MESMRFTPRLRVFVDIAGYSGVRTKNSTKTMGTFHGCVRHPLSPSVPPSRYLCVGRTPTGCS